MNRPRTIEGKTFWAWFSAGILTIEYVGEENIYAYDEWGFQYVTKHEC